MKNFTSLILALGIMLSIVSCTNSGAKKDNDTKKVTILYPNWAEGIAFTHLAKVALESNGYEVEITNLEPGLIYGELSKSNSKGDVFLDAWLPNTHKDYWNDYGDKLAKLGEAFSEGTTGLVVPSYVTINSIEELNENKAKLDGQIIGIGSGAGIHANTLKVIDEYGLDFEQITASGPAMVASLEKAMKKDEWIVITGWKPHFMWANYDLKYLEDPKGIYPKDVCAIISRKGFEEDMPKAATFFKHFNLEEGQLYDLMANIKADGEEEGTIKWYEANKTLVDSWFAKSE
ncbi:glycine betaine ABC transporter substrate-binding protein [Sunxiuqinia sp. A32]|uniref:glycine betaine ABC transporter substrate-binding protein n=1 Tax=Sunxiuqinia sp. A32 TaxID=3461496 RepID=UPI004045D844